MLHTDRFFSKNARTMSPSIIRKMSRLVGHSEVINFAGGMPNPEIFPTLLLREAFDDMIEEKGGRVFQYGVTRGVPKLIEFLEDYLRRMRDIDAKPEEIIVVSGSQQGLDLVSRVLLDPGDVVFVELPNYIGATSAFKNVGAEVIGFQKIEAGADLGDLVQRIEGARRAGRRAKLIYINPNFQNPTGLSLTREARIRLLEIAATYDLLIFEDDPYGEIYFDTPQAESFRPIKSLDDEGRVIYLNSFSKILVPGLRVAWVTALKQIIYAIELAKQAADICTSTLSQKLIYEYCLRGRLYDQITKVREFYGRKCQIMLRSATDAMADIAAWTNPQGGFFVWLTLKHPIDAEQAAYKIIDRKRVAYVPGGPFYTDGGGRATIRLSFSNETDERIREGMRRLGGVLQKLASDRP